MSQQPFAAGVVLIDSGGQVLLLERPDGSWTFPGGRIDPGETPEQAATRECSEECGYTPDGLQRVGEYDGFVVYKTNVEKFTPRLNNEHKAFVWVDPGKQYLERPYFALTEQILRDVAGDGSRRIYDINGWFEVKDNPISRSGVFPYSGRALGIAGREDEIFYVLRPDEEIGSPECIESFKLLPWIDDHVFIGPSAQSSFVGALPAEKKGIAGVIGESVYFRDGVLYGNIKVYSDTLAAAIAGGKKELSAGYRCRYEEQSGVWNGQPYQFTQKDIRGNHLALVDEGRMGPTVAVLDSSSAFDFTCDEMEFSMNKKRFKVADLKAETARMTKAFDAEENGEISLEQLSKILLENMPRIHEMLAALEGKTTPSTGDNENPEASDEDEDDDKTEGAASLSGAGDQETETPEAKPVGENKNGINDTPASGEDAAEIKALRKTVEKLKAAYDNSEATFIKRQAQRNQLAERIEKIVGVFDHQEMTLGNVVSYGVRKLGMSPTPGHELTALDAYLTATEKSGATRPAVRIGLDGREAVHPGTGTGIFDAEYQE